MDEKGKLFVFSKKEVFLIFAFMLLTAITSFYFGVKIGKGHSFQDAGLTTSDRNKVDLYSGQEENVHDVVEKATGALSPDVDKAKKDSYQLLREKIDKEFKSDEEKRMQVAKEAVNPGAEVDADNSTSTQVASGTTDMDVSGGQQEKIGQLYREKSKDGESVTQKYSGKYTIQMGSHQTMADAEKFADGFRIRGYNPIIQEVEISGRGVWYRVNLGVFDSLSDAKDYVLKQKSLFQGQEYVIGKFE